MSRSSVFGNKSYDWRSFLSSKFSLDIFEPDFSFWPEFVQIQSHTISSHFYFNQGCENYQLKFYNNMVKASLYYKPLQQLSLKLTYFPTNVTNSRQLLTIEKSNKPV